MTLGEAFVPDSHAMATILIVDDTPTNLALMVELLRPHYRTRMATSGDRAIALTLDTNDPPDLILLDIMMPVVNGYDVCRRIKAEPRTRDIPIIFLSAMGAVEDETLGLELGGVDYVTKPIRPGIVLARVRTHLAMARQARDRERGITRLEQQAGELSELNRTLEQRIADGVAQLERLSRLKRYFSPSVVDLMLSGGTEDPLKSHRREVAAAFVDLRGFTAFTETSDPEDVMQVMHQYHDAMGALVMSHGGTLEHFAGDGMMVYFNDPVEIDNPALVAVTMAIGMQARFAGLEQDWHRRGYSLSLGIGVALGFATIGAIGFEGRRDYGVIGNVTNLAARLCGEARGGQILVSQRVHGCVTDHVCSAPVGNMQLKGFANPVAVYAVSALPDAADTRDPTGPSR